jgi:hypothetical protein
VAHWEMVVRHDEPATVGSSKPVCQEMVRRGEMRVTQPARLVLGGLATLGHLQQVVCTGCGSDLMIVRVTLRDVERPRV